MRRQRLLLDSGNDCQRLEAGMKINRELFEKVVVGDYYINFMLDKVCMISIYNDGDLRFEYDGQDYILSYEELEEIIRVRKIVNKIRKQFGFY